jgi:hypothetical protein
LPASRRNIDPEVASRRAQKAAKSRTTPEYHLERLRDLVGDDHLAEFIERTTAASGVPSTPEDRSALACVAAVIGTEASERAS